MPFSELAGGLEPLELHGARLRNPGCPSRFLRHQPLPHRTPDTPKLVHVALHELSARTRLSDRLSDRLCPMSSAAQAKQVAGLTGQNKSDSFSEKAVRAVVGQSLSDKFRDFPGLACGTRRTDSFRRLVPGRAVLSDQLVYAVSVVYLKKQYQITKKHEAKD